MAGVRWTPPATVTRIGAGRRPAFDFSSFPAAASTTPTLDTATAWWTPSDITGGTTVVDQVGALDLTLGAGANEPTVTTAGGYNVIDFDGTNDYIEAAHNANLSPGAGQFTLVAVVNLDALGGTIFSKGASTAGQNWVSLLSEVDGDVVGRFHTGGGSNTDATHTAGLTTGVVYGLSMSRDASSNGYGGADGSRTSESGCGIGVNNSATFRFGGNSTGSNWWNGKWYGAAWWNTTQVSTAQLAAAKAELLTAAEV